MRRDALSVALATVAGLSGCGGAEQGQKLRQLEERIASLEAAQSAAKQRLDQVGLEVLVLKYKDSDTAWFDPQAEQAYTALKTSVGSVLFVLEKVEPYLDGFKVTFRIGNPTSAAPSGFKAKVQWGKEKAEQFQSKDVELSNLLPAGTWSLVTVNVGPAKAEEIRQIGITPQFGRLSLRGG